MTSISQPIGTGHDDTTTRYAVQGMTCSHCVHAVTEQVTALSGVRAVDEAGYRLA